MLNASWVRMPLLLAITSLPSSKARRLIPTCCMPGCGLSAMISASNAVDLAALGLEAHRADHVGPLHQARGVGNRQAAEAGHARRAVDQAQTVLGAELNRLQTFFGQCLLRANDLPAIAHIADTQQRNADVGHVGQVTDRTLGRHLRGDAVVEQRQQSLDHRR